MKYNILIDSNTGRFGNQLYPIFVALSFYEHNKDKFENKQKRTNYTIKKSSTQMPIIFIIQESDHVGQQNIIGFLTSKEYTQPCYPIFH